MTSRTIELSDLGREVRLSDLQVSPDGRSAILIASRPNYEENRFEKEMILVDVQTGQQETLTSNGDGLSHARWSPNGRRVAFLEDDENGQPQVFIFSFDGEPVHRLTDTQQGVKTFAWHPDGEALAFVTEDPPGGQPGNELHNLSFEVGDQSYLSVKPPTPSHIWITALTGGNARQLTTGQEGFSTFFGMLSWSPDGRSIAFTGQPVPDAGGLLASCIRILDMEDGQVRNVGPRGTIAAAFSPSGDYVALCRPRKELGFSPAGIHVLSVSDGSLADLTTELDRDFLAFGQGKAGMTWTRDGQSLLLSAHDGTRRSAWIKPLEGASRRLGLEDVHPTEIAAGPDGKIYLIGSTPHHPNELYCLDTPDGRPRPLTAFNKSFGSLALGNRTTFHWPGPDGFEGTGVLTYPPEFDSKGSYPLVLDIHGGPMSASTEAFNFLHHLMAARGWIAFSPNYRGSNNLGEAYQRAVINDAGDGPARDIISGLRALEARGFVERDRIAISGWSYGGFLTAWLTAHGHDWRAAVAGAAVSSWVDWYNLADLNVWSGTGLGGSPWREGGLEHYLQQSAITYARNIRTPMLLISMTGDRRVSVTQSYKLYHALKDNGTEVQFIAYPIGGHFPADPVHERDVYRRWVGWIDRHFQTGDRSTRISESHRVG